MPLSEIDSDPVPGAFPCSAAPFLAGGRGGSGGTGIGGGGTAAGAWIRTPSSLMLMSTFTRSTFGRMTTDSSPEKMLVAMPATAHRRMATRKNLTQPTVASQSPSLADTRLMTGADARAASAAPAFASAKTRRAADSRESGSGGSGVLEGSGA